MPVRALYARAVNGCGSGDSSCGEAPSVTMSEHAPSPIFRGYCGSATPVLVIEPFSARSWGKMRAHVTFMLRADAGTL